MAPFVAGLVPPEEKRQEKGKRQKVRKMRADRPVANPGANPQSEASGAVPVAVPHKMARMSLAEAQEPP